MDTFLPEEIRRLREDNVDFYVESKMTVESFLKIREMQIEVSEELHRVQCPQLIIQGSADT